MTSGSLDKHKDISGVLRALEKAARVPNLHMMDLNEVFSWENWSAFQTIDEDVDPFDDDLDSQVIDADSTSRFMASTFEIDTIISMLSVLSDLAKGIQTHFRPSRERIIMKLSRGIGSLPDELVTKIFQFAVWEEGYKAGRQAILLSQVSRRFRNIALAARGLWTTLCSSDASGQLRTFASRGGRKEFFHAHVHYDMKVKSSDIARFTSACQPAIARFETLTLTQESQDWDDGRADYGGVGNLLGWLLKAFSEKHLRLHKLEEINIYGKHGDSYDDRGYGSHRWTTSKLRTLNCSYFLPAPSNNFSSVTHFAFTQSLSGGHRDSSLKWLFEFLLSMPKLATFDLEVHDATSIFSSLNDDDIALSICDKPSITSFTLRLRELYVSISEPGSSRIAKLMNILRMPSLRDLCISVGVNGYSVDESEVRSAQWTQSLYKLTREMIPDHLVYTSQITSLSYELWFDRDADAPQGFCGKAVNIPLDRILNVTTLTLSSFVRILFTQECSSENALRTDFGELSRLRELKFVECENMTVEDLKWTVWSLRVFGVWKNIERVVVEDCYELVYEELVEVVGEERLRYLD
ncbi:hypothetical protein SCHPADRAFT_895516 [Schizopora paradoxa]|uniref:F-box domain-containing protein n=1 Tax=Schizopora paradoxa TaxID=27342 RepID=A0A0H2RA11_9AGAM|nr:hypothetical protein SCHPADRAFT_895516 [Schizopora paradoxa]